MATSASSSAGSAHRLPPLRGRAQILSLDDLARRALPAGDAGPSIFSFPPTLPAEPGQVGRQDAVNWRLATYRAAATLMATGTLLLASHTLPVPGVAGLLGARADFAPPSHAQGLPLMTFPEGRPPAGAVDALPQTPVARSLGVTAAPRALLPSYDIQAMRPTPGFIAALKDKEGLRLASYRDSGGVWTIGYGHTGLMPDGRPIGRNMRITMEEAEALLTTDLDTHAEGVRALLGDTPVTQSQFEALLDFAFNKGLPNLESSTLLAQVRQGDYLASAEEFLRWIYVVQKDAQGRPMRDAQGKLVTEVLPALQERAQDNYTMMRSGLPSRTIALLEDRRVRESTEARALRAAQAGVGALRPGANAAQSAKNLDQAVQRVQRPLDVLAQRLRRQERAMALLSAERRQLVDSLHAHVAVNGAHVGQAQGQDVTDLTSRIAVLERLQAQQRAEQEETLAQRRYWEHLDHVLVEAAALLRQGDAVAQDAHGAQGQAAQTAAQQDPAPASRNARLHDQLTVLAQTWRELAETPAPAGVVSPLPIQTTQTLGQQTTTLARVLAQATAATILPHDDVADDAASFTRPRPRS